MALWLQNSQENHSNSPPQKGDSVGISNPRDKKNQKILPKIVKKHSLRANYMLKNIFLGGLYAKKEKLTVMGGTHICKQFPLLQDNGKRAGTSNS